MSKLASTAVPRRNGRELPLPARAHGACLLGAHEPDDVTVDDLERVLASVSRTFTPVRPMRPCLSFWRWMRRRGSGQQNPAGCSTVPGNASRRSVSSVVHRTGGEAPGGAAAPGRHADDAAVRLRDPLSEACALQLLRRRPGASSELHVIEGKGGKGRIVDLPRALLLSCRRAGARWTASTAPISCGTGVLLGPRRHAVTRETRRAARALLPLVAPMPRRRRVSATAGPHTTRHTFATRWLRDGGTSRGAVRADGARVDRHHH